MIDVERLVVRYRSGLFRRPFTALDGMDLQVHEGDFFALLGQNGAGKSTAMYCLLGLLRPSAGTVRVFGQAPVPGAAMFRNIGYLPEEPHYHPYLTVEEALVYYASLSGVKPARQPAAAILERLGLAEHRRLRISRCSKGMKQKLGIAQCLLHQPRLLLLDEPMRGLDPMTVHLFRDILKEMNARGATIVMNSHILSEVELVATRVAIIDRGRLVVQDAVSRLVAGDPEVYAVEIDGCAEAPPLLSNATRLDGRWAGTVAAARIYDFMEYTREQRVRVITCALKHTTLEEKFVSIVEGQRRA